MMYEALEIVRMASGHVCLNLSDKISWEDFPSFAELLLNTVNGKSFDVSDSVAIRMWHVKIEGVAMLLVFDDFPLMVSLESQDARGDVILGALHARLSQVA